MTKVEQARLQAWRCKVLQHAQESPVALPQVQDFAHDLSRRGAR